MTFEELRVILNNIADSEDKSSLEQDVDRLSDEGRYTQDLLVSTTTGRMVLVDEISSSDEIID